MLRPETTLTLSMRLPPMLDSKIAKEKLTSMFTEDVPYNAKVSMNVGKESTGMKRVSD